MAPEHAPRTSPEVGGMGHSIKRKEDPRFIRGQGTYVDDVQLPGMLYLDIVRSPYAHAKIVKIDTAKALAIPGVLAVITGQDLAKYNLHWMPTLMSDTQMVLPVEKVMYQAQEVAAVLATERYIAADGADAVEVQYEPLPVVVDPKKALEPGAPVLRTDKKDKHDNHIWHWEWGDRAATDRAFREAAVTVKENIYLPRIHVASIETCGCIADWDKPSRGQLNGLHITSAGAARRCGPSFALVAGHVGLEEQNIRDQDPRTSAVALAARCRSIRATSSPSSPPSLTGKPVKWIEDRIGEPPGRLLRPGLPHPLQSWAPRRRGKITSPQASTPSPTTATATRPPNPSKFPAGLFNVMHRLVRLSEGRLCGGGRRLHEQAAWRRSPIAARSGSRRPSTPSSGWWTSWPIEHRQGPGPAPNGEFHPARASSRTRRPTGWEYDSVETTRPRSRSAPWRSIGYDDASERAGRRSAHAAS